eukprot:TRINITY_DN33972_c0_g1_i1.p1 TRINITY_DN33972_c0_g1~~TRINITY_DN33972_c0_g1_i1.p1  ORF type:complete len:410 (+),score=70.33 TRINITY_DN33972_c0_g1_i1:154-1383(+)
MPALQAVPLVSQLALPAPTQLLSIMAPPPLCPSASVALSSSQENRNAAKGLLLQAAAAITPASALSTVAPTTLPLPRLAAASCTTSSVPAALSMEASSVARDPAEKATLSFPDAQKLPLSKPLSTSAKQSIQLPPSAPAPLAASPPSSNEPMIVNKPVREPVSKPIPIKEIPGGEPLTRVTTTPTITPRQTPTKKGLHPCEDDDAPESHPVSAPQASASFPGAKAPLLPTTLKPATIPTTTAPTPNRAPDPALAVGVPKAEQPPKGDSVLSLSNRLAKSARNLASSDAQSGTATVEASGVAALSAGLNKRFPALAERDSTRTRAAPKSSSSVKLEFERFRQIREQKANSVQGGGTPASPRGARKVLGTIQHNAAPLLSPGKEAAAEVASSPTKGLQPQSVASPAKKRRF